MGHEHDGFAGLAPHAQQFVLQAFAGRHVQSRERLVHQQDRGPHGERAGQRHALALAARQLPRPAIGKVRQADKPQRLHGALAPGDGWQALFLKAKRHVGDYATPRQQARILKHQRHRSFSGGIGRHDDFALALRGQPHQHAQQR